MVAKKPPPKTPLAGKLEIVRMLVTATVPLACKYPPGVGVKVAL
jgi:hypothetical protein